jgi:amino acid transporter
MSDIKQVGLKSGAMGLFGAVSLGAVMMSPALGIYGNFGPMTLTAGKTAPLVFLLALFATLPTAICYAMISREIPSSGSVYTWLWEAVSPAMGVWIGCILTVFFIIVVFLQPLLFGLFFNDLCKLLGIAPGWASFAAGIVFSTGLVAALTYRGVNVSEKASLADLVIQMVIVAALAVTILVVLGLKGKLDFTPFQLSSSPQGYSGIALALIFGMLSFTGFGVISNVAEETRNPRKTIPVAIVLACVVVGLYWVVVSWAYVIALPAEQVIACVKQDVIPVVPIARTYWGFGDVLIILTGMIAALGVYIATIVGASRVLYAMGRDGAVSLLFGRLHEKYQTPWPALHLTFILTLLFVLLPTFFMGIYESYIWWGKAVVFFALFIYLFVSIANPVFYWRFRRKQFSLLWNGIIAIISFIINFYLLYKAFFVECWNSGWAMGRSVIVFAVIMLLAALCYTLWLKKRTPALFTAKAQFLREPDTP